MATESGAQTTTLRFHTLPHLVILVHGSSPPSNADWEAYMDALATLNAERAAKADGGVLVVTDGENPSAAQRESLNARFPLKVRAAVVTSSAVARGVVTIFSWFNPLIRGFTPSDFNAALTYLNVDPSRHGEIRDRVADMRFELATGIPRSQAMTDPTTPSLDAVVTRLSKLREDLDRRRAR